MVHLLRKYQQPLMIVITLLTIISFAWLYNRTNLEKITNDQVYRVFGKNLTQSDIDRMVRRYGIAVRLDLKDLVRGLGGGAQNQNQEVENFIWNSFVLDHESKALGITPTDGEIRDAIEKLPILQTNDTFDPSKYQQLLENFLSPNGFTETDFEDLLRDDLRLKKLVDLVGSAIDVTPAEFQALYVQDYQKMDVSLVRFKLADFAAAVQPAPDAIKKYYTDHKNSFVTEERRAVSYVRFGLTDDEKKLKGKDRTDAMQKLSDRANDFGQAMLEPNANFTQVGAKQGLKVETTPEFSESQPAPALVSSSSATAEALRITEKEPTSGAVSVEGGFYILHLDKLVPSRALSEQEATPKVIEQIKNERGHDALVSKANEVHAQIDTLLKTGKSFSDAVVQTGQKVDSFPPFSAAEPVKDDPDANVILEKTVQLPEGGLSELVATADGGILIHLDKHEPIDMDKLAKVEQTQMGLFRMQKRLVAFHEWLQICRKGANIQLLSRRS